VERNEVEGAQKSSTKRTFLRVLSLALSRLVGVLKTCWSITGLARTSGNTLLIRLLGMVQEAKKRQRVGS
jgi:hypothetical protein